MYFCSIGLQLLDLPANHNNIACLTFVDASGCIQRYSPGMVNEQQHMSEDARIANTIAIFLLEPKKLRDCHI